MTVRRTRRPATQEPSAGAPQADMLRRTREDHAHEITEDYLEAIAVLVEHTGEARVTDLARQLGVTHVTVTRTISRLQRAGYVNSRPYRAIFLTEQGRDIAAASRRRHETVVRFLRTLGVPDTTAQRDAEGIEHHVSPDTLAAMEKVLAGHGRKAAAVKAPKGA